MSHGICVSPRIENLRFPLIVGVVFIHNYSTTVNMAYGPIGVTHSSVWVDSARFFFSEGIARVAVPLFFLISGYLFFLGGLSWRKYVGKIRRRISTLLIPFLFWNILTLAVYAAAQSIPQTKLYISYTEWPAVHSFTLTNYLNAIFGTLVPYPISYQFWFIRDLMALVVLAPAIHYLLAGRLVVPFISALFCLWFFGIWPILWPSVTASFFFALGAYLSRPGKDVSYFDRFGPWISLMFLIFLTLQVRFPDNHMHINNAAIVFGVPTVWWLSSLASRSTALQMTLMKLSGASFFVFAAHEPFLKIARKILYKVIMPTSGIAIFALYFLVPICLISLLVITHWFLLKAMPSFMGFVTGNSGRPQKSCVQNIRQSRGIYG